MTARRFPVTSVKSGSPSLTSIPGRGSCAAGPRAPSRRARRSSAPTREPSRDGPRAVHVCPVSRNKPARKRDLAPDGQGRRRGLSAQQRVDRHGDDA